MPNDILIAKVADDDPDIDTVIGDDLLLDSHPATTAIASSEDNLKIASPHLAKAELDPESLRKHVGWLAADIVRRTLESTTQYARVPMGSLMQTHYKSPFPALNVKCRLHRHCLCSTSAQFFVGRDTGVCVQYGH